MRQELVKVADAPGFVRDVRTGAVLNTSSNALDAYRRRRNEKTAMLDDINTLKSELIEIKGLLRKIVDQGTCSR